MYSDIWYFDYGIKLCLLFTLSSVHYDDCNCKLSIELDMGIR